MTWLGEKLSFDRQDQTLLGIVNEVLNRETSVRHVRQELYTYFHPNGIKEMAESRGLRIAYAVVNLLSSLEGGRVADRLNALRCLRDEALSTASGALQKNTARVLIQIMKELVRARGDHRRQLRLAHDFRTTASGKPFLVRTQLQRYHLLEMPEEWNQLSFDDHVHDANTKGRKTPTHLIMDAWIKGIRRLTVIYYNFVEPRVVAELMEAAAIMDLTVRIGIEFSARFRDRYVQLIWIPYGFKDSQEFLCFLAEPDVTAFMAEGRKVSAYQQRYVMAALAKYNRQHRLEISRRFGIEAPELQQADFLRFVGTGQPSLLHLSKFIHVHLFEAMDRAVERLRKIHPAADEQEQARIAQQVAAMAAFDSATLKELYLRPHRNPEIPDPGQPHDDDPDVPGLLRLSPRELMTRLNRLPCASRTTLNLSNLRVEDVLELLYETEGSITQLELFNLKDHIAGQTDHLPAIADLQQVLNNDDIIGTKRVIQDVMAAVAASERPDKADRLSALSAILHDIVSLQAYYKGASLRTMIGSDSTGRSPRLHGMGLAVVDTLPRRARHIIARAERTASRLIPLRLPVMRRVTLIPRSSPNPLVECLLRGLRRVPGVNRLAFRHRVDWMTLIQPASNGDGAAIVALGGIQEDIGEGLTLTPPRDSKRQMRLSWRYLNTTLKNCLKVFIGFLPAFATFYLTKDWWVLAYGGAFIWFGITGLRNILQSVLGGGGLRRTPLLKWDDYVSWTRIADSLLFTGFSVPLLDYLVKTLVLDVGLGITTTTDPVVLYTVMGLANGIYLSSHNALRGLPRGAIYGNLLRSVLAIPIAIGLNAAIGTLLIAAGHADAAAVLQKWAAVISKAASDTVAGVIEGTADRYYNTALRVRDFRDRFKLMYSTYAQLEMLFPDAHVLELIESPEKIKRTRNQEAQDMKKILIVCSLDLLFFWWYKPRAQQALKSLVAQMGREERRIVLGTQLVLQQPREISQLFIDGLLGNNFSRPLAFYLDRADAYLDALQLISFRLTDTATAPVRTALPQDPSRPLAIWAQEPLNPSICTLRPSTGLPQEEEEVWSTPPRSI
jgi:hypothetical protein